MNKYIKLVFLALILIVSCSSLSFASNEVDTVNIENSSTINNVVVESEIKTEEMEFEDMYYSEEEYVGVINEKLDAEESVIHPTESIELNGNLKVNSSDNIDLVSSSNSVTVGMKMYTPYVYQTEAFSVYLTDNNENRIVLSNQPIYFTVNGVTYLRYTDEYGIAKLNINLIAREEPYLISIVFNGYGSYSSFSGSTNIYVSQKPTSLSVLSSTVHVGNQFKVKLTDSNNIPVANKIVNFYVNGVSYQRTTDEQGYGALNINLNPGIYSITVSMDSQPGYQAHSSIVTNLNVVASNNLVQSVLTPISSIIKQGNQFSVKLTSGTTGLPLVGRTVAITVNGISYYKVTDSEGIARLTINLNIGTYKITAEFVGDSNYKSSSVYKLIHVPNLLTSNDYEGLLDLSYYKSSSNYYCDFSSSYIQSLAYNLTKTCSDDLEKSISIHNYVNRINYDNYSGAVNSALNTLLSFEGNCVDQSSSLVALARAVSLPVRYVIGLPIEDGKDGHAWAQICIDNIFIVSDPTNVNSFGDGSIVSQVYTGYEYGVLVT